MPSHTLPIIGVVLLIAWSLYRRVRRTLKAQLLNRRRLIVRSIIFIVIGGLLAATLAHPIHFVWDAVGIAAGLVLAFIAIANTRYEHRADGWYYRPNAAIGAFVILLFVGRVVYRLLFVFQLAAGGGSQAAGSSAPMGASGNPYISDPWTASVIFVILTYYACYFLLLVRKEKQLARQQNADTSV